MKTYQDLIAVDQSEKNRIDFILGVINEHKASERYKTAEEAEAYARQENVTIMRYQKLLYTLSGKAVPDNYSANHKMASNFFNRFVVDQNQYLLGNGVTFKNEKTKEKLGKDFDTRLQVAGLKALVQGVSFGFYNYDHLEVFDFLSFAPLYDEENGALMAGVRFWQIDIDKPLRFTLYEIDGYTDYIKRDNEVEILREKRPYILKTATTKIDGTRILDGMNYPTFPIVPLWGNPYKQSELVGFKGQIDAYDLIKSGFADDLDSASMIYWTLENCGGMDDIELVKFVERMKIVKAAVVDGDNGARAESHTIDVPYQSREAYLSRLKADMYEDFQALNVSELSANQKTATEIRAAYQPLDNKVDQYEYCVIDFIHGLLAIAGIDDEPSFTRSRIVNQLEETEMILSAASYLDEETIIKKLPFLSVDEITEVLERRAVEEVRRNSADEDDALVDDITGYEAQANI